MKKEVYIIMLGMFFSCGYKVNNDKALTEGSVQQKNKNMNDTTPKVTGIGGIFFRTKDSKKTKEWYGKNLGLAINDYGSSFEYRNANNPKEIN